MNHARHTAWGGSPPIGTCAALCCRCQPRRGYDLTITSGPCGRRFSGDLPGFANSVWIIGGVESSVHHNGASLPRCLHCKHLSACMLGSLPTAALRCVRGALRATVDKAVGVGEKSFRTYRRLSIRGPVLLAYLVYAGIFLSISIAMYRLDAEFSDGKFSLVARTGSCARMLKISWRSRFDP